MVGTTCTICLDDVKSPVSIPCGHLHCEGCLVQYVEQHDDVTEAPCPTCRAPFCIAIPDLRFVPQKYHKYLLPTVRRVYLSQPAPPAHPENPAYLKNVISALEGRAETLEGSNTSLRARVASLDRRIAGLNQDKDRLMDRCEAGLASISKLRESEREARHARERAEKEMEGLRRKYEVLKSKYRAVKHTEAAAPSPLKSSKRTSAQAALDADIKLEDNKASDSRLILPIPKRPRMATGGWRPTVGEIQSELEDVKPDVKIEEDEQDEMAYESAHVKEEDEEDEEDQKPSPFSISSGLLSAPSTFTRVKRESTQSPKLEPASPNLAHLRSRLASASRKMSDNESEDDDEDPFPPITHRIPRLDISFGQKPAPPPQRAHKLKPSGLSRVFQSMDVDDSDYSPSTSASSPQVPTPGPSSRPTFMQPQQSSPFYLRPSRSGLPTGDVFSPRRSGRGDPNCGHGSIDYSSSPLRMAPADEEDNGSSSVRRSYVFRGRKIGGTPTSPAWTARV